MESKSSAGAAAVGAFFNVLERLVLFALSLSVGLLNLLIGLVVAAHLGVIPKTAAARVLDVANRATALVSRILQPSPAPRHKAKR